MNLRQQYTKETGKDAYRLPYQQISSYTTEYIEWLEQQLRQYNVVRQSEQLICVYCGINPTGGNCPYPKKCSTKKKIKAN